MNRPLEGTHIWCTRPGRAGERSCRRLHDSGARITHAPTLRIEPRVPDDKQVSAILAQADHLVVALTSPTSVENFVAAIGASRPDGSPWPVAAVGERTALRARELGLEVLLTSPRSTAADFGPALLASTGSPAVLLPGSNLRREELAVTLRAAGREVIELVVQETRPVAGLPPGVADQLEAVDLIVAYSPSALGFVESLDAGLLEAVSAIPFAVMGPTTGARAQELGLSIAVQPDDPHEDQLFDLICRWAVDRD